MVVVTVSADALSFLFFFFVASKSAERVFLSLDCLKLEEEKKEEK